MHEVAKFGNRTLEFVVVEVLKNRNLMQKGKRFTNEKRSKKERAGSMKGGLDPVYPV